MKRMIAVLVLAVCLMGCGKGTPIQMDNGDGVRVCTYDGCEYIRSVVYGGITYCHKGNCKNPIHIYNKEK